MNLKQKECVKGLNFLKEHAMEYQKDFDWDENPCGEYENISKEDLKEYVEPLEQLIKEHFKLVSLLEKWGLQDLSIEELDKWHDRGMYHVEKVNELSKKLKEYEWISVVERLPDSKGEYLVSYHPCYWDNVHFDTVCVGFDSFLGKTSWSKRKYQRVIAWMPLPEPYKGDEKKKKTKLEYVDSKGIIDEFNKNLELCVQTLLEEHKEIIKLTQFEFDLLKAKLESYGDYPFSSCKDLWNMKDNGYFKDVTDTTMTIQEILDNCEVTK